MSYDKIPISDLEILAAVRNYRKWIYRRLAPYIGQRVLEIGAGIENFTKLLLDRELVVATDNYTPCVEYLSQHLGDRLKAPPALLDASGDIGSQLSNYELDTIVCLNVLEHSEQSGKQIAVFDRYVAPLAELTERLVPRRQAFRWSLSAVRNSNVELQFPDAICAGRP